MVFKFENVGIVQKADVKLDGLTVIGGENDTGKSTVGKLLFAIVKGITRYEQDLKESKEQNLDLAINEIYFDLRRDFSLGPPTIDEFQPSRMQHDINGLLRRTPFNKASSPSRFLQQEIDDWMKQKLEYLSSITNDKGETVVYDLSNIAKKLEEIKKILSSSEDKNTIIKRALKKAFHSEFFSEITPKHHPQSIATIHLSEGNIPIFDIKIKSNGIETFDLKDIMYFEDATFVETPVVLQLYDIIRNADTLLKLDSIDKNRLLSSLDRPKVSLHIKDLVSKLEQARYYKNDSETGVLHQMLLSVQELIEGEYAFDEDLRDFVFIKKHQENPKISAIRPVNTASGIKSFGIIQLLLKGRFIDRRSLLIIDEPETHLHPKWQIEYARLLVKLVKNEIPILLTSHSPYLIQALKVFSEKEGLKEQTNFYLAEKNEKTQQSVITDVTEDLNRLFQKLSEPLQELVWS